MSFRIRINMVLLFLAGFLISVPAYVFAGAGSGGIDWVQTVGSSVDDIASEVAIYDAPLDTTYVYAAGATKNATASDYDYIIVKYNAVTGVPVSGWPVTFNGATSGDDITAALAVDAGGVYVTGKSFNGSNYDIVTQKYAHAGTLLWTVPYDGGTGDDEPRDLTVDASGNVYLTGTTRRTENIKDGCSDCGTIESDDIVTIAYDTNGVQLWTATFDGIDPWPCGTFNCNSAGKDRANAIVLDSAGNVIIAGMSSGDEAQNHDAEGDYVTIKYDPAGAQLWAVRYDGTGWNDEAATLAVDGSNNVYVTGRSKNSGDNHDYATIKYDPDGIQIWANRYDGTNKNNDEGRAIAVDSTNNVYVTGLAMENDTITTVDLLGNTITTTVSSENYVIFKYDTNGNIQWKRQYNDEYYLGSDRAYAASVRETLTDSAIYVTGVSANMFVNLKYSLSGTGGSNNDGLIWAIRYSVYNRMEAPSSIAVDASGNAYVAGIAMNSSDNYDMVVFRDALDDSDNDGMSDSGETRYFGSITVTNNKNGDEDGDGLTNIKEFELGSNPNNFDSDGDGMPDDWELNNYLNMLKNDAAIDSDNDGYNNLAEYENGTDPFRAQKTYYVDGSRGSNNGNGLLAQPFKTIEWALSKAQANDTVKVFPGVYQVNSDLIIPADVKLLGKNWYQCSIDLQNLYQIQLGNYSTLRGFKIFNPALDSHALVVSNAGSVTITNNVILGQAQEGFASIFIENGSVQIVNNTLVGGHTAISTDAAHGTVIYNNIIADTVDGLKDSGGSLLSQDYNGFWESASTPDLFVDAANGNYHLPKLPISSPGIDKGNPAGDYRDKDHTRNDLGADGGRYGNQDNLPPSVTANATPQSVYTFNFTAATDDEWGIANWSWDFDSRDDIPSDSALQNPAHTYTECGGYIATLTVTDRSGNQTATTVEITVDNPPEVTISADPNAGAAALPVTYSSNVSGGSGDYSYDWDFGDGSAHSNESKPSHTFTDAGRYLTILKVTDNGCVALAACPITVLDSAVILKDSGLVKKNTATSMTSSGLGGVRLEIPENALAQDAVITVSEVVNPPALPNGAQSTGTVVDFGPDGLQFSQPVKIALPYSIADPNKLQFCYYDSAKKNWNSLDIINIDTANQLVWAQTTHFTAYALLNPAEPLAPSNLSALSVSSTQIYLTWTDNANNESGFEIERRKEGEAFSKIATISTFDSISYADNGLEAGTKYYYRIRAINSVGASDYSNETSSNTYSTNDLAKSPAQETSSSGDGGASGGCFIATAAYGTPMALQVRLLSQFRDKYLLTNAMGSYLVKLYYRYSPPIADFIAQRAYLRQLVRIGLYPFIGFSYFMLKLSVAEKLGILLVLGSILLGVFYRLRKTEKATK
ncbi:MAG: PKD domain-containing protein [Candidatus Schekmanbacteria bacterium]|nr:PKD domain-containing protein [Candidatus Schekmanbacteria bacterium]